LTALFLVAVATAAFAGWLAFELADKARALLGRRP
jgi:NO-binding membrane sensor protein with MHYT domain